MERKDYTPEQAIAMLLEAEVRLIRDGHFAVHCITPGSATGFFLQAGRWGTSSSRDERVSMTRVKAKLTDQTSS